MNAFRRLHKFLFAALTAATGTIAVAQCTNTTQYPSGSTIPDGLGAVTTITTCSFQQEYSVITSIVATATYQFTIDDGTYITVHQGTYDGPVLGYGSSPVTVQAVTSEDLFAHWSTDANCGTATNCRVTTVQLFLNCTPPTFTTTTTNDCANNQFYVNVNVSSTGDGATVNVTYNVDGGAPTTMTGLSAGSYQLGPFPSGALVNVTVEHESDPACNQTHPNITNFPCPILSCGPDTYTHCYANSESYIMVFEGTSSFPLRLQFNSGSIYQFGGDVLRIYDGLNDQGALLYTGIGNNGDLTGVIATSTNVDHALCLKFTSDAFTSCADGGVLGEWNYTVGCLDCTPPTVTGYTVVNDCANQAFNVSVDISDLGSDPNVEIANNVGVASTFASAPGTYIAGPFPLDGPVQITLVNELNSLCNITSATMVNAPCPIISCGPDTYTHCYANNEVYEKVFQGTSTFPLRLQFNSGSIYQFGGDVLTIYDGLNDQGAILYNGLGNAGNLAGVFVTSTNVDHALYLKLTTDGFTSCFDGGIFGEWNYTVGCLDCTPPVVTSYVVNTDCANQVFTVDVNVNSIGTDLNVEIANNVGVASTFAAAPGVYTAGPFPVGNPATITLVNELNALCNVTSTPLENTYCPIQITCGNPAFDDSYCYHNSDSQHWLYQNTGTESLALLFSSGTIESVSFDHLVIYDGVDNTGSVIYTHTGGTVDLTGVLAISTGPAIYMEMSSDGSVCCSDNSFGAAGEWNWTVGCLDCTQAAATYNVVLDCANNQYYISTHITGIGSDPTITLTNTGGAPDVAVTDTGTYSVGPFAFGTLNRVNVVNDANTLCSVHSDFLTNAPCPLIDCGPNTFTLCYHDAMDSSVVYQSANAFPVAIIFNAGQLDTYGDSIYIYDGLDFQAPVIYAGVNNFDLADLLFTSTNIDNALLLRIRSDQFFGSCFDGTVTVPWDWTVSCLDCTNPAATFEMIPDCAHHGYNIAVNVTSVGTAPSIRIANSYGLDTLNNVGLGITMIGPIPVDTVAHLTLLNSQNSLCRIHSGDFVFTSDSCVTTACDPTGVDYCYANSDTAWFVYHSGNANPITLTFSWGTTLVNDFIQIYNGLDTTAQIVYMGNNGGNLAGLSFTSNNADNALLLRVISSQVGSCATGQTTGMYWVVGCGLVGMDEVSGNDLSLYPNPTTGELFINLPQSIMTGPVDVDVLDVTGRLVRTDHFNAAGQVQRMDLSDLQNGNYAVVLSTSQRREVRQVQIAR